MVDIRVQGEGSIYLLHLETQAARIWVGENVQFEEHQIFGESIAVEHRYVGDIVQGALAEGLVVA